MVSIFGRTATALRLSRDVRFQRAHHDRPDRSGPHPPGLAVGNRADRAAPLGRFRPFSIGTALPRTHDFVFRHDAPSG